MSEEENIVEGKDYTVEEGEDRARWWICMYCKKKFKLLMECKQHIEAVHKKQ